MRPHRILGVPVFAFGVLVIVYAFVLNPDAMFILLPVGTILTIMGLRMFLGPERTKTDDRSAGPA